MKNIKRALALLMTLCLVLPMCLVAAVTAEEATPIVYNFYDASVVAEGTVGDIVSTSSNVFNNAMYASMAANYASGAQNALLVGVGNANSTARPQMYNNAAFHSSRGTNFYGIAMPSAKPAAAEGGLGDWLGFMIKNPGAGTYSVEIDYRGYYNSTRQMNVYIIPASAIIVGSAAISAYDFASVPGMQVLQTRTSNPGVVGTAIADAISDTYLVGSVNTRKGDTNNHPNDQAVLANYTFNGTDDYIVVFEAELSYKGEYTTADVAALCVSGLSLIPVAGGETPETPENPENPETPENPENPETPETPENPETPEEPSEKDLSVLYNFVDTSIFTAGARYDVLGKNSFDLWQAWYAKYASGGVSSVVVATGTYHDSAIRPYVYNGYDAHPDRAANYVGLFQAAKVSATNNEWFALMIKNPGTAGVYNLTLNFNRYFSSTANLEVYMIPASAIAVGEGNLAGYDFAGADRDDLNTFANGEVAKAIEGAFNESNLVGTLNIRTSEKTTQPLTSELVGDIQMYGTGDYVLAFRAATTYKGQTPAEAEGGNIMVYGITLDLVEETPDFVDPNAGKDPETPENPENPEGGETPETPENPEGGETPENPENPEGGETPENPEGGETPENPENPEGGETPEEPAGPILPTPVEGADYDLFHEELLELEYSSKGLITLKKAANTIKSLYDAGKILAYPFASSTTATVNVSSTAKGSTVDGYYIMKGHAGDWHAFVFRTLDATEYDLGVAMFCANSNHAANFEVYLLSADTTDIAGALVEENLLATFNTGVNPQLGTYSVKFAQDKALEANTEYIMVLKATEDLASPADDRIDFMLSGLIVEPTEEESIRYGNGKFTMSEALVSGYVKGSATITLGANALNYAILAERYDVNGWMFHSSKGTSNAYLYDGSKYESPVISGTALAMNDMKVGDYIAIQFKNPGAGSFNVALTLYRTSNTKADFSAYIIPANTENVEAALTASNLYCSGNMYGGSGVSNGETFVANGTKKLKSTEDAGDYLLVVKISALNSGVDSTRIYLNSFSIGDSSAATGDNTPVMLLGFIALISLGAVCVLTKKRVAC